MERHAPFAHVLHSETIAKLARGNSFERGKTYAREGRVKAVAHKDGQLVGVVQGSSFYAVCIWIKGDGLGYVCSCPSGGEGNFCKHCVALAVAWVDKNR